MVPPLVSFHSVVALIDRFPVLAGLSMEAHAGEIVLLRGPNGAGKTSLLRAVAGLLPVTQGDAVVLGCDIRLDRRSIRSQVGLLGHQNMLYQELSAIENVEFVVRAAGLPSSAARVALDRVGLPLRTLDLPVERLSAGQRRRVALAGLLARDPQLWLLDEPHTGLDHDARDLLDSVVAEAAQNGRAVLFSSHEVDRVAHLAARTLFIDNGVVDESRSSNAIDLRGSVDVS